MTKKEEGSLKERRLFEEVLLVANSPDISLTNVFSLLYSQKMFLQGVLLLVLRLVELICPHLPAPVAAVEEAHAWQLLFL